MKHIEQDVVNQICPIYVSFPGQVHGVDRCSLHWKPDDVHEYRYCHDLEVIQPHILMATNPDPIFITTRLIEVLVAEMRLISGFIVTRGD